MPGLKLKDFKMNRVGLVVFALFLTAALTDLGFLVFGGVRGTISTWMVNVGLVAPFPVFVLGMLSDHFFLAGTMFSAELDFHDIRKVVFYRLVSALGGMAALELVRYMITGSW
jgi:hypothetical protein